MPKVFMSYVRDDWPVVRKLAQTLSENGIEAWLDRERIKPGERWQDVIRTAIADGDFFLACFSVGYNAKMTTYMNEEITLAIEQLRLRPTNISWFIPVKLDGTMIPARKIAGNETLHSIQWADLDADWDSGVSRIIKAITPDALSVRTQPIDREEIAWMLQAMSLELPPAAYELAKDGGCPNCKKGKLMFFAAGNCSDGPWNYYSCTVCDWTCEDFDVYGRAGLDFTPVFLNRLRHQFGLL